MITKTMLRELIKSCKSDMKRYESNPFCAYYKGAKFQYFWAVAKIRGEVALRHDKLKEMYDDFQRQAAAEGWRPAKVATFEDNKPAIS